MLVNAVIVAVRLEHDADDRPVLVPADDTRVGRLEQAAYAFGSGEFDESGTGPYGYAAIGADHTFPGDYDEGGVGLRPLRETGRTRIVSSGGRNQYYQVPGVAEQCYSQVRKHDEPAR